MSIHIIMKKSDREIRERAAAEAPKWARGRVDGYARDIEEADRFHRNQGRDNPANKGILTDDGGKAEKELRDRTLRNAGYKPEEYEGS